VGQNPLSSLEQSVLARKEGDGRAGGFFSPSDIPISGANIVWSGEHRGFAVRAYFENNQFVIATQ
jgi:hypothetical protein